MAFANAALSDIISSTIQNRSGDLADSLTQNNIVLKRLEERGNIETVSGGNVILQELLYDDPTTNNANSYSGLTH